MLVIGERINASNKAVAQAITERDEEYMANLARAQAASGADFIDVNVGPCSGSGQDGVAAIEWLVDVVQAATDKPLAIDSDAPEVIEAALRKYRGDRLFINSVTAEPTRLASIGALAAKHQAWLVALAMGENGIPESIEERVVTCGVIMAHLMRLGMKVEQVFFDPLVLPIAVDVDRGMAALQTIEQIKSRYPAARTVIGLSNISYGLPNRQLVNRTFLSMAAYVGLDAVILDPLDTKVMSLIKTADMLTGKDRSCRAYIRACRQDTIVD